MLKKDKNNSEDVNFGGGWNYRIIYHPPTVQKIGRKKFPIGAYYAIHEVYYDKKGELTAYSTQSEIMGDEIEDETSELQHKESLESIKTILNWMINCLDKPILYYKDFHITENQI